MDGQARERRTLGWTMVLVGAVASVSAPALRAQTLSEQDQECRCVDGQGEPIEHCTCFRTPNIDWTTAPRLGNRARIGVSVGWDQPPQVERGVRVLSVLEGGPAERAGLREGDLITRVGGRSLFEPLEDSDAEGRLDLDRSVPAQRLVALLGKLAPGDQIDVEYVRDDETRTVSVTAEPNLPEVAGMMRMQGGAPGNMTIPPLTLGSGWPMHRPTAGDPLVSVDPCFLGGSGLRAFYGGPCIDGVDLVALNPDLASYFGTSGGVLVTDVREGSALALRPGDVIVAVDGREVAGPDHARRVLESYGLDEDLTLRVIRHGEEMEILGRRR